MLIITVRSSVILTAEGGECPLSSSSSQVQKTALSIDSLPPQTYVETWMSPAAFQRIWATDEEVPIRFYFHIDIIDQD